MAEGAGAGVRDRDADAVGSGERGSQTAQEGSERRLDFAGRGHHRSADTDSRAAGIRQLLEKTRFSMAQQNGRYYLNGLLLETDGAVLRAVATDGRRMAVSEIGMNSPARRNERVIVPLKGVLEFQRLLDDEGDLDLILGTNHVGVQWGNNRFTSKLIDGRFPEYERYVPKDTQNVITAERSLLRQALQRAAILCDEKYRGVRLDLVENKLNIQANNPEREEAEETINVEYGGTPMEIGSTSIICWKHWLPWTGSRSSWYSAMQTRAA